MADWVEKVDSKSGKTYFLNRQTKETTWTRPPELAASTPPEKAQSASTSPLPDPWVAKTDSTSGKTYYVNRLTKETSWTRPTAPTAKAATPTAESGTAPSSPTPPVVSSASSPWVEKIDPASGKTYYVNRVTKETSWTKPAAAATASASEVG